MILDLCLFQNNVPIELRSIIIQTYGLYYHTEKKLFNSVKKFLTKISDNKEISYFPYLLQNEFIIMVINNQFVKVFVQDEKTPPSNVDVVLSYKRLESMYFIKKLNNNT
jgi:hypothetical protein